MSTLIIWPAGTDDALSSLTGHVPFADLLPRRAPHWCPLPRQDEPPSLELLARVLSGLRRL